MLMMLWFHAHNMQLHLPLFAIYFAQLDIFPERMMEMCLNVQGKTVD